MNLYIQTTPTLKLMSRKQAGEEARFPRGTTNQKYYPDLRSERHQNVISVLVPQTWFWGKTSGGVAKRRLFS